MVKLTTLQLAKCLAFKLHTEVGIERTPDQVITWAHKTCEKLEWVPTAKNLRNLLTNSYKHDKSFELVQQEI